MQNKIRTKVLNVTQCYECPIAIQTMCGQSVPAFSHYFLLCRTTCKNLTPVHKLYIIATSLGFSV